MDSIATDATTAQTGAKASHPGWLRYLVPSLADLAFVMVFAFAISLGSILTSRDGDLGYHLRLGETILTSRSIPLSDTLSHTALGGFTVPHEWLSEVSLASAYRLGGFDGVAVLTAVALALPWALIVRKLLAQGRRPVVVLPMVLLGAAGSVVHWAARPHVFSFALVALWLLWLEELRTGVREHLWRLIPLTAIWANLHPSFSAGLILVGIYLVGSLVEEARRTSRTSHLAMLLGASLIATLINPVGPRLLLSAGYLGERFLLDFTTEWNSPDFHLLGFWPFLALLLASLALATRLSRTGLLVIIVWTSLALYARRNVAIYALVATPLLAAAVDDLVATKSRTSLNRLHRALVGGSLSMAVIIATGAWLATTPGSTFAFNPDAFPVAAIEELRAAPPGQRVFNQFAWGGYLAFCCEIPVFIDGRTDYFGPALASDYEQVIEARPGYEALLDRHGIDWVLVAPTKPLAQVLALRSDWVEVYRDRVAVAFDRAGG